jgi:hypothetical protein
VKIKLMIISLLAVVSLQGMNNSSKDTLTLALNHCIDSESYRRKYALIVEKRQRRVAIHYFNDTDEQYSSDDKIKKIVASSLKRIFVEEFAKILTIQLLPEGIVLSEDHNEWLVNRRREDKRTIACVFYNISNNNRPMSEHVQKIQLVLGLQTPLLININSSVTGALEILNVLGQDVEIFNKEVVSASINKILDGEPSLDILVKKAKELNADAKKFDKSQPGYISNLKTFFTNRWIMASGFSLAAFLVYYYKFVR